MTIKQAALLKYFLKILLLAQYQAVRGRHVTQHFLNINWPQITFYAQDLDQLTRIQKIYQEHSFLRVLPKYGYDISAHTYPTNKQIK